MTKQQITLLSLSALKPNPCNARDWQSPQGLQGSNSVPSGVSRCHSVDARPRKQIRSAIFRGRPDRGTPLLTGGMAPSIPPFSLLDRPGSEPM